MQALITIELKTWNDIQDLNHEKSMNIVGMVDHEWSHFDVECICKNDIRLLVCLMMIVGPHFALFFFFLFSPPYLFPHACCGANMSFKAHGKF